MSAGSEALDAIATTVAGVRPDARELALLALLAAVSSGITAMHPELDELTIIKVADRMVMRVRMRVDQLDGPA